MDRLTNILRRWAASIATWTPTHRHLTVDVLRMYLGVGLFVRGILFLKEPQVLLYWIDQAGRQWLWPFLVAHYVILAHLVGGLLLAVGLFTRFAALIQVPVLLGATLLVHWGDGLFTRGQSLELTALVLFLLLLLTFHGSGRLSLDHYLRFRETPSDSPVLAGDAAVLNR